MPSNFVFHILRHILFQILRHILRHKPASHPCFWSYQIPRSMQSNFLFCCEMNRTGRDQSRTGGLGSNLSNQITIWGNYPRSLANFYYWSNLITSPVGRNFVTSYRSESWDLPVSVPLLNISLHTKMLWTRMKICGRCKKCWDGWLAGFCGVHRGNISSFLLLGRDWLFQWLSVRRPSNWLRI